MKKIILPFMFLLSSCAALNTASYMVPEGEGWVSAENKCHISNSLEISRTSYVDTKTLSVGEREIKINSCGGQYDRHYYSVRTWALGLFIPFFPYPPYNHYYYSVDKTGPLTLYSSDDQEFNQDVTFKINGNYVKVLKNKGSYVEIEVPDQKKLKLEYYRGQTLVLSVNLVRNTTLLVEWFIISA